MDNTVSAQVSQVPGKRSRRKAIVISSVVVGLCLVLTLCGGLFLGGNVMVALERDDVERSLHQFMLAMARKNTNAAYALFCEQAQETVPLSKLQEMVEGNNHVLFDRYDSLEVRSLNIGPALSSNPKMPQGIVARAAGETRYTDGSVGNFQAVLQRVNGEWKLAGINVTVPPEKFGMD
ncbi:MAG TPA: hypothetical protein VLC52_06725 [Anaerolineae bacterium]|nr:hypothetical protein [Anaerolineae bacterium]